MGSKSRLTSDEMKVLEPPQDIAAEQAVLGSVMKDATAIAAIIDVFDAEDYFYVPKHRQIFRAMLTLFEKNEPCDITTVADELAKMDQLEKIGGRVYLIELVTAIVTTAHVTSYANIILEKALLRNLISVCNDIELNCYQNQDGIDTILDEAESSIFGISQNRLRKGFIPIGEMLPRTFEQIENYQDTKGGLVGLGTGFPDLDNMTAGLHNGDFIVIAGRPSMGKTAFALNIAQYVGERNVGVGIFSIEMSKEQLALRFLCSKAKINQHMLRTGRLRDNEWAKLAEASGPMANAPIFIDDSATLSTLEMRAKARRLKAQHNIGMIIVDYIQMIHSAGRAENRQQEMSLISRGLKTLAKELEIPVVACSQLSRMVEMRGGDKRPQLSDLRESGAIEQDADVVMFVYRPEFYLSHLDKDDPKRMEVEGKAEIIVAKQRNGPTGLVNLAFLKEYVSFANLSYQIPESREGEAPF
ncbi:Replicative DNA helicase [Candidatus Zixiibacteriota bacterium]|nr:Replicative DNA helicase [candidate division Zixibacteria bacterium]